MSVIVVESLPKRYLANAQPHPRKELMKTLLIVSILVVFLTNACTRKKVDPEMQRLEKGVTELETQELAIEEKMKNVSGDDVIPLSAEKALLKSRKERLKEILKSHGSH